MRERPFAVERRSGAWLMPAAALEAAKRLVVAFALFGSLGAACTSLPRGATPANWAQAKADVPRGWSAFERSCAGCHGQRGESVSGAPAILGPGALPELPAERNQNAGSATGDPEFMRLQAQTRPAGAPWRDPFRTAEDLYGYVSKNMPLPVEAAGSLSADEYWSVVNFMLLAQGVGVPPEGVTPENAGSVRLQE